MKLATYAYEDGIGIGAVLGEAVADLRAVAPTMRALLADPDGLARAAAAIGLAPRHALDRARLRAPIPDPRAFLGIGLNYRDHAAEVGRPLPETPAVFAKLAASVAPPYGSIERPGWSETLDYEGELGVVIGRPAAGVTAARAPAHVAGYVVVNDVTMRALAKPDTLVLGKSGRGHGPFGPWLTTADEVPDPHALSIRTWVNGELRQDSSTAQLHRGVFELVEIVSRVVPLEPGDVIATGSPRGSGVGFAPPRWLVPGDRVRVEIERLGAIEHRVADAPLPG